jgi:hypothetical protein
LPEVIDNFHFRMTGWDWDKGEITVEDEPSLVRVWCG